MGTLFEQTERNYREIGKNEVIGLLDYLGIEDTDENKLKAYHALAYERRTDFMLDNGDRYDEQMAGFGKILQGICESVSDISDHMRGEG